MTAKVFTIKRLDKFLGLADEIVTPKFVDTENRIAFFHMRFKRIEYKVINDEDIERLLEADFIEGTESDRFDY